MHQTARDQPARLRFGPFEIDRIEGRLYKHGVPLRIENHPFLVLAALLERPDDIVSREELQHRIWGDDTNVSFEDGLNTAVRKLRYALSDSADSPMFIETVPKRGYRFVAPLISVTKFLRRDRMTQSRPNPLRKFISPPGIQLKIQAKI